MRRLLDENELTRWFEMVRRTLESARGDLERGDYNWSCFKAHQSAEYAVKALLHGLGLGAYGHSISALLSRLSDVLNPSEVMDVGKTLDKYYVPTRYPNAWGEGLPTD